MQLEIPNGLGYSPKNFTYKATCSYKFYKVNRKTPVPEYPF